MKNIDRMCLGCMGDLPEGADACPNCGWGKDSQNDAHELEAGSVLAGKYLVGKALGQGGFGITYLAWDIPGERRVAIKEYYPSSLSTRQRDRYTVSPFTGSASAETFAKGRNKFFNEAKSLAQFSGVPGIVSAYDFFEENGTAYIVMEYLEGRTLKEELISRSQPMTMEETLNVLKPVAAALEAVHASGLIHRDISPDNIMLTPDGAKLLDFGAARAFSLQGERSNTINVKMGYAPAEQYNVHGQQGAWTDVYALAATVYRCVTGRVPEQYYERTPVDYLTLPSKLNRSITPEQERVILTGMAVDHRNRYQTVRELMEALKNPLSAPWYATKTDKFVGGDAKTVPIDESTLTTANIISPTPPPAPAGDRERVIAGLAISILGSLAGLLGFAALPDMARDGYGASAWAAVILQVCAILCTWPILSSAFAQLKGQPRGRWTKLTAAVFILALLIPVGMVLFGAHSDEWYCGVMDTSDYGNLIGVLVFIVAQLAAGVLVFGSPFPVPPNDLTPRRKLIRAFCLSVFGMFLAIVLLTFMMPAFYDRYYDYNYLDGVSWYTYFIGQMLVIGLGIPALMDALHAMGGAPRKKWPWPQLACIVLSFLLALLMLIPDTPDGATSVVVPIGFFLLTQIVTGICVYGPISKDNISLKRR